MRCYFVVALLVAGCGGVAASSPTASPQAFPDVTLVDDRGQVVEFRAGVASAPAVGIIGLDDETVFLDSVVDDALVPIVADTNGQWVAYSSLPAGPPADGTIAPGQAASTIVAISPGGDVVDVELPGNLVPEAFSLEPQGPGESPWLYVLEYLPAEAPTHYRVRVLDPNTGDLSLPLNLRAYGLTVDTEMSGISRDQVVAGDEGLLFTLYRGHHFDEGTDYAFIHVLSMWNGVWCLDVPAEMELAARPGVVAVSPDEKLLYAVSSNGFVAEYRIADVLDPNRTPLATRAVPAFKGGDEQPAAVVTTDHVVVAQGRTINWLERDGLTVAATATAPAPIDALAVAADGSLVVAMGDRLGTLDRTGAVTIGPELPAGVGRVTKIVPG